MAISERKGRIVVVSGTTWTTDGSASRIRWDVTRTAGCRKPASRPSGMPSSRSTTSPELGIEPGGFLVPQRRGQFRAEAVLPERTNGQGDGVADARVQLR